MSDDGGLQPIGNTGQGAQAKPVWETIVSVSALAPGAPGAPDGAVALLLLQKADGKRVVVYGKAQGSEVVPIYPILS